MHSHEDLLTAFSLSADLLLRSRLYAFAERKVLLKRNTLGGAVNRRSEKNVQQRRPPPAADTGRSCWGRGQQDTSATQGTKWSLGTATRLSEAVSFFPFRLPLWGLKGASSPFLATATTAACGGNREELLGPRSAGHECRPRHEVDAGYRNPSDPARRNRWCFSGPLLARKRELSPAKKRSTPAPPARENALRHIRNAPQSPLRFHRAS